MLTLDDLINHIEIRIAQLERQELVETGFARLEELMMLREWVNEQPRSALMEYRKALRQQYEARVKIGL